MGKRENADNQHFLLFPQLFFHSKNTKAFNFGKAKIVIWAILKFTCIEFMDK